MIVKQFFSSVILMLLSTLTWSQSINKADSLQWVELNEKVINLYNEKKLDSALKMAIQSEKLAKKIFGTSHISYANALVSLTDIYHGLGNYSITEPLYKRILIIRKTFLGCNHPDYATALNDLAVAYHYLAKYSEAEPLYEEALKIRKIVLGNDDPKYANSLNNLAVLYYNLGNYIKAEPLYVEAINIRKKVLGENHPDYVSSLNDLALLYKRIGSYSKAEPLYVEVIGIRKKVLGENHLDYASSINNLAYLYQIMGNYSKAEPFYVEAINIRKKALGENHPDYANSLNDLALLYKSIGNYSKAESLYVEALNIRKKAFGADHPNYATILNNLAFLYENMGNYLKAEPLFVEALNIRKKAFGTDHPDYTTCLSGLANLYKSMGNYSKAEPLYIKSLEISRKVYGIDHPDYGTYLYGLADLYKSMGNYSKAEPLYIESLEISRKVYGIDHPDYGTSLYGLADFYERMGNYSKAEPFYIESLEISRKVYGIDHPDYATRLYGLAGLYKSMGNYSKAEPLYIKSLEISRKVYGIDHPDYGTCLYGLADLYKSMGNYSKAEPLYIESLQISKKVYGVDHPDYATNLSSLASLYKSTGNFSKAQTLYVEALNIRKKVLGTDHPEYSTSLYGLADLYKSMGNYSKAEPLYIESLEISRKVYGIEHPDYAYSLNGLISLYYNSTNQPKWKDLINYTIATFTKNEQLLINKFSEEEKLIYLADNKHLQDIFYSMLYYFNSKNTNSFYLSHTAKQGWLLQSKQQLNQFVNSSDDSIVLSLLQNWQYANIQYGKAITLSVEKRKQHNINLDSLAITVQQLEKQLIKTFPSLANQLIQEGIAGREVALKLKQNEVVIDWIRFSYKSPKKWTDSVLYAAFIITPKDTAPKFITVFEEKQLQHLLNGYHGMSGRGGALLNSNIINRDTALFCLIWQPLLSYIGDAKVIYNLPSGLLHKVSFAALTDRHNKQLIDKYEIHQLSSINELISPSRSVNKKNTAITLFGAADFDAIDTIKIDKSNPSLTFYRNALFETGIKFSYLPGTEAEIANIVANANTIGWRTSVFTKSNATEFNLKSINSISAPKILHIATHGFYFPPAKVTQTNSATEEKNVAKDFPLLRSGIVLSGANNYWGKDTILENKEDGIVTAQEISSLNLLKTDLVVLSACQTALGDINGSEGVYGLQRAFKMAGAKKLLMSLWEVPDAETAELMQLFYTNLFKGDSYYKAFRDAQLVLKAKYKDPNKWAGFVLVGE